MHHGEDFDLHILKLLSMFSPAQILTNYATIEKEK